MSRRLFAASVLAFAAGFAPVASYAAGAVELIKNGSFETHSTTAADQFGTGYTSGGVPVDTVAFWTTSGYNFLFTPGSADTTGATGSAGNLKLWGPNDGSANGMPATSPVGGNFVAADGAYQTAPIQQTVGGLEQGTNYLLTFWWAAAQQQGFSGTTTENWGVTFGNNSYTTATVTNPDHGFTPWRQDSVVIRNAYFGTSGGATSGTSQVLSFLAAGTPNGTPPFSLLDGVSLVAAPEPATWGVLLVGLTGFTVAGMMRQRRRAVASV